MFCKTDDMSKNNRGIQDEIVDENRMRLWHSLVGETKKDCSKWKVGHTQNVLWKFILYFDPLR